MIYECPCECVIKSGKHPCEHLPQHQVLRLMSKKLKFIPIDMIYLFRVLDTSEKKNKDSLLSTAHRVNATPHGGFVSKAVTYGTCCVNESC